MAERGVLTLAHGAGGVATTRLIEEVFLSHFGKHLSPALQDSATLATRDLNLDVNRLAFTTDSFVVSPTHFPGGDIGKLAVCGTVNDLAVAGAIPLYLSAAFILEEGLPLAELESIVRSMAEAASEAKVKVVTGDTKVVARGQADKIFITTSGVGVIPQAVTIDVGAAEPGDAIILNGYIGDHGAAVMLARDDLGLHADVYSDCAPLNDLVSTVLSECPEMHVMRDATRGGVSTVLNEIAAASNVTIALEEELLPIRAQTRSICELLGLDPLLFANEGLVVFVVPQYAARDVLGVMRKHRYGKHACQIGKVTETGKGLLYVKTAFGSKRILDIPYGIQLPRIC